MELGFDPGLILLSLAPVFIASIIWEAVYWHRRRTAKYKLVDTLSNAGLALMHQGADLLANLLFIKTIYSWVYHHGLHLLPNAWWSVLIGFVLQDFLYYWFHRGSHRIRWMWASHVTHHSSERLNLSTAFRQSLTYPISGMWVFWVPMAWVGFSPDMVILIVGLSLAYQFFVHTEAIDKMGWFERLFNTPSHHRVHHARNPQYIDRNYAGVLIIWDKLFGTYVEEVEAPEYRIVRQIRSHNPLRLTFHEWFAMWADTLRDRDPRHLWKPPEWQETTAGAAQADGSRA
ncbi:MAG: sterol desaturase family protein [Burkholderiales bacterium]|nr:sterol desaturase family protein [Burkholderiales bacterium]